jgi:glycosyltransferase involved in cell wall biosynthesis
MPLRRRPGISVLIPTQNEQYVVEPCIRSFLEFGDELIVVDNGSTDRTKDIVTTLARAYPEKIRFLDRPDLPDLHQNRAAAYAVSRYQWVVRADSDYVCYTSGDNSILHLRRFMLEECTGLRPHTIWVPQVNLVGDFYHTGVPYANPGGYRANEDRQYITEHMSGAMPRFYRTFPGFGFIRVGRREYTRFPKLSKRVDWPNPVWVHCTIKSDLNHLYRSERSNWRELGDFERYPTLDVFLREAIEKKYGTRDVEEAARIYMQRHVLPYLEPWPDTDSPIPEVLEEYRSRHPIFEIVGSGSSATRRFLGFDPG